ncbi:MAG: TonB-dependent receptor [Planctomycetota bacterium]|nr:TonB-dependent receptor [Planctomycetota bacterium]
MGNIRIYFVSMAAGCALAAAIAAVPLTAAGGEAGAEGAGRDPAAAPPAGRSGEAKAAAPREGDAGRPKVAGGAGAADGKGEGAGEAGEKEAEAGTVRMEKVIVTARRSPEAFHTTVDGEEAIRVQRTPSVDFLLKDIAGVDFHRKTFAGSDAGKVSIRGFDESRSAILLNGRSLHGAGVYGGYYVDWASLSLEEVERVEVLRGAGPAKYGNALGGVVNIVTKEPTGEPKTSVRTAAGMFSTWNAEAVHSWGAGPFRYSVAAGHYETDGYLRNAFVERNAAAARLVFNLPLNMEVGAGARYTNSVNGMIVYNMPGSPYYDRHKPNSLESQLGGPFLRFWDHTTGPRDWGDGSYWRDNRWQIDCHFARKTEEFGFAVRACLFDEDRSEYFYAVDNPRRLVLRRDSRPEYLNWGVRADFNHSFEAMGRHRVECGFEGQYIGYGDMEIPDVNTAYFPPWAVPTRSSGERDIAQLNGGYLQDIWKVFDWLDVYAGLRFDSYRADDDDPGSVTVEEDRWSPRVALTFRPWKGGSITGRYVRAHRFPTQPEYYWWYAGYRPAGRKALTSEKAHQFEIEVGHRHEDMFEINVRGYYYEVDDYIRTIFGYMPSRVVYNIDKVVFGGVEVEAAMRLGHGFSAWANYTWQKTEKRGDVLDNSMRLTDELPELPENKVGLGVEYRGWRGLEGRVGMRYVGARYAVRGNQAIPGASTLIKMDGYVDADAYVSYPVLRDTKKGRECRIFLSGENLLDQDYEEEYGYPMPGATFMGGVSVKF